MTNDQQWEAARHWYLRGIALQGEGMLEEAAGAYRASLDLVSWPATWFNLGLVYKRLRRWPECLRCNQRAVELEPDNAPAWWNLGIAATALRDWPLARAAWRGHGIQIPDGAGPIELDYGWVLIRLASRTAETVWCWRIDPARAIIRSVPRPGSAHRWGDCLLHDGEPVGAYCAGDRRFVVFNELARWQPSAIPTLRIGVVAPTPADATALSVLFDEAGLAAEDWTGRQAGTASEAIAASGTERSSWRPARLFGLAGRPEDAAYLLRRWAAGARGRRFSALPLIS